MVIWRKTKNICDIYARRITPPPTRCRRALRSFQQVCVEPIFRCSILFKNPPVFKSLGSPTRYRIVPVLRLALK